MYLLIVHSLMAYISQSFLS